jgi:serine/threonine protein kinase
VNIDFYRNIPKDTLLFGRFKLLDVISASDSSAIYKVQSTWGELRDQILVLKVTHIAQQDKLIEDQILREIKVLSRLNSKYIIKAFDWFRDDEFLAYSMEYVDGGTLESICLNPQGNKFEFALNILTQTAIGLRDIHNAGIIHRDIKPQNILISKTGEIKIADFGISVRSSSKKPISSEQITGTVDYVSPEYIRDGIYDLRSDIYALGTLAFQLFTGHVPFEDESIVDALARKASQEAIKLSNFNKNVPQYIVDIVAKCLKLNPEHRFQSVDEIIYALSIKSHELTHKTTLLKGFNYSSQIAA